jgi:hypothetical protein
VLQAMVVRDVNDCDVQPKRRKRRALEKKKYKRLRKRKQKKIDRKGIKQCTGSIQ